MRENDASLCSSPGSLARGSLEKCPSDCNTTRYDARLSYAPLSETVLATLTSDQRARLQSSYRDALDVRHRVDEKLMASHVHHLHDMSTALSNLNASVIACVAMELSVSETLLDMFAKLDSLRAMIDSHYSGYTAQKSTRDALANVLSRQRESIQDVSYSHWYVAEDDTTTKTALALEMISATRDVILALGRVQYAAGNFRTGVGNVSWDAGRPFVIVEKNACVTDTRSWREFSGSLLTDAQYMNASVYSTDAAVWAESARRITDQWSVGIAEWNAEVIQCIKTFDELLLLPVSPTISSAEKWRSELASYALLHMDYAATFSSLLRSPLIGAVLKGRFENNTVSTVDLLATVQDDPEYKYTTDILRHIQAEVKYDLLDHLRDFMSQIQDTFMDEYVLYDKQISKIFLFTGDEKLLNTYYAWYTYAFYETAFASTMIDAVSESATNAANLVAKSLQRYKAFLEANVKRADMNQKFVR